MKSKFGFSVYQKIGQSWEGFYTESIRSYLRKNGLMPLNAWMNRKTFSVLFGNGAVKYITLRRKDGSENTLTIRVSEMVTDNCIYYENQVEVKQIWNN